MSEQNHLELGRVILDFPIQAYTIKSLHVHEEANAHGSLSLLFVARGPVSEQDCIRYADSPIRILDDQGNPIFCGTCSLISTHNLNQYCEVQIEAHTHSQKMDVAAHSRTFQDPGKMLSQVLEQMLEPYGALFQIQEDKLIPEMLSQQAETDWDFIKRICNQFGYPIFVNSKVPYIQLSIGAVPFSSTELPSCTDTSWIEKDISQYWKVKNQIAPEASAYEFLQKGFTLDNLTVGAGHMFLANGREMFVTRNDIYASGGLLYNRILLTYKDGVYAQLSKTSNFTEPQSHIQTEAVPPAFKQPTNQPTGPSALFGKVLAVSGTDVQVLFDVDVGGSGAGVRWIPYCNFFNNDFYCMPDVGDTVFCYYENEGSAICLGSKHINNTRDDFSYPWEKMMTANNRMIRFKSRSVEFNANRKEYDGEDDQPVKIVLSEDTGIEISSEKDINIVSDHNILIQSNDLDAVKENPIEWFESSRKKNMQQFDQDQQKGENKYISDGGSSSCNAGWEMVKILGGNLISGFANDITEPFQLISTLGDMFGSSKKEDTPDKPPVSPEEIDTYKVDLFAVESCKNSSSTT